MEGGVEWEGTTALLKKGGLILMNPVTRKLVVLTVVTIPVSCKSLYALVFDSSTVVYKVVHLFLDGYNYPCYELCLLEQGHGRWWTRHQMS